MAISMDLRVLARNLEKSSDDLLANASDKGKEIFEKVATAVAAASTLLESVADDMDHNAEFQITPEQLDEIAALASAFDESNDPLLKKQASVLDEILLSIGSSKSAIAASKKVTEDEINRLRTERSRARREEAYEKPREAHHDMWNTAQQAKAVEQYVKRYRPLEAPLQTRYPPDRPGGQMTRISDHVYQDILTGIIYDFKAGYTTQKGNKVPGGSVENQTRELGDYRNQSASLFETRESLMGRYASGGDLHHIKKYAMGSEIARALKAVRDLAPEMLDQAIAEAQNDGLSTGEVGDILADVNLSDDISMIPTETFIQPVTVPEITKKVRVRKELEPHESLEDYRKAVSLLSALRDAGWTSMIRDYLYQMNTAGMSKEHLKALHDSFVDSLSEEGDVEPYSVTLPPPSSSPDKRASLTAIALGAIQELAPHLLSTAVSKAQKILNTEQIDYVLASNLDNKFKKASFSDESEIQVARSLFPHMKALGWNDLIKEHIRVMASFGINPKELRKLADEYVSAKSSYDRLRQLIRSAGVQELVFEDEDAPALELSPFEETEGEVIEPAVVPAPALPVAAPAASKRRTEKEIAEIANLILDHIQGKGTQGSTLQEIEDALHIDQKLLNVPLKRLLGNNSVIVFGDRFFIPGNEEDFVTSEEGDEVYVSEDEEQVSKELLSPYDDLEKWIKAYEEVKNDLNNDPVIEKLREMSNSGRREEAKQEWYKRINEHMNARGFVGAYEKKDGVYWKQIADKEKSLLSFEEEAKSPATAPKKSPVKTKSEDGPPAKPTSLFDWGSYQKEHDLVVTEKTALEIEKEAKEKASKDFDQFKSVFTQYKFPGKEFPKEFLSLPESLRKEIVSRFSIGDKTEGVLLDLENILNNWFKDNAESIIESKIKDLAKDIETHTEAATRYMSESSAAKKKGDKKASEDLKDKAQVEINKSKAIQKILANPKFIYDTAYSDWKQKHPITKDVLKITHAAVTGDQSIQHAKDMLRQAQTSSWRWALNESLESRGFPMKWPSAPRMTLEEFTDRIRNLGKTPDELTSERKHRERQKSVGISPSGLGQEKGAISGWYSPPGLGIRNKDGVQLPLKTLWEDPKGYMKARSEAFQMYPPSNPWKPNLEADKVEARDLFMKVRGYVPLSEKIFGSKGSTAYMLYKVDPMKRIPGGKEVPNPGGFTGDPLVKVPDNMITLFTDPNAYITKYREAMRENKKNKMEIPKEFYQIHDGNVPMAVINKLTRDQLKDILSRMLSKDKLESIVVDYAGTIDPKDIEEIYSWYVRSGERIRKNIWALILQGYSLESIESELASKYPKAKIPENVVKHMYASYHQSKHLDENREKEIGDMMEAQGFYSPFKAIVGVKTAAELLEQGRYRPSNVDPQNTRKVYEIYGEK